jgi:hypothetical protein
MDSLRDLPLAEFMKSFNKIEPLSNIQITDICKKLKIKNFKGVFMRDELKGSRQARIRQPRNRQARTASENECFILNHDLSCNNGTHWTCLFVKNGVAFYFDSFGLDPPLEILDYCKGLERYCSTSKIQKYDEVICGHYSIFVLYSLSKGISFFDVLDELYRFKVSNT